jgi:hypothetical protein
VRHVQAGVLEQFFEPAPYHIQSVLKAIELVQGLVQLVILEFALTWLELFNTRSNGLRVVASTASFIDGDGIRPAWSEQRSFTAA